MPRSVRRVVTGHDARGKAVVLREGDAPNAKVRQATGLTSILVWVTDECPADVSGSDDRADRDIGVAPPARGSIFRVVDFPPLGATEIDNAAMLREMGLQRPDSYGGARNPLMHRTRSIDYAVVISGEIDMLLDNTEVHLKAGDVLVQQGTIHAWVNRGADTCRVAFVLIDAEEPSQLRGDVSRR
jgi:mannose-6-phosphate isomerase-like protein (cupin superfamily)